MERRERREGRKRREGRRKKPRYGDRNGGEGTDARSDDVRWKVEMKDIKWKRKCRKEEE